MNKKIYLAVAMFAALAASFVVVASSDGLDAASYNASSLTAGTTYTLTAGTSVTIVEDSDGDHEYYATPTSFTVSTSTTSVKIEVFLISTEEIIETYYVYFVAPSPTYTVSFSPNPSGYGTVSTSSFTVDSGTTFSASGSTLNFSDGHSVTATPASSTSSYIYSFTNWSPSSGTVTAPMSITAYFQRTPVTPTTYSHTLYFDANGGSGAPSTMTYDTSTNTSYTFTIPNTVPTKSGYVFGGWSNNGTTYQPNGSISVSANSSKTLTAIWNAQTYSIGASVPYATGGTVYIQDVTAGTTSSTGTSVSLTVNSGDSIRIYATASTGYTFSYWWDDDSSEDVGSSNPFTFTASSGRNLSANFSANTYTVTFDAATNGGTVVGSSTKSVTYGSTYGTLPSATKSGSTFNGWFTASSGGTQITSASTVSITSAQTLYAQFTAGTYSIGADVPYGTGGTVYIQNVTAGTTSSTGTSVSLGATYGDSVMIYAVAASGYSFDYWWDDDSSEDVGTSNPFSFTVNGNRNLSANFNANTYTVSFSTDGGAPQPSSITVTYGQAYGTLPTVTKTGYSFNGWYTAASGGTLITAASTVTTASDHTLYAQYTAGSFTISADVPYGTGGTVYIQNVTAGTTSSTGTSVSLGASAGDSVQIHATAGTGYTFSYWWDVEASEDVGSSNPFSFTVNGNRNLSANFVGNTYTVTFDANGGSPATQTKNVTYGMPYGTLPAVAWSGYSFDGWFTASSGGDEITSATTVTITAAQTLYAHWTEISDEVYWANGNYNGKVDIVFKFDNSASVTHTMSMDLYTGSVTDGRTTWTDTGHDLQISLSYYPKLTVSASLSGTQLSATIHPGAWNTVLLSLDSENGIVTVTPIRTFTSFIEYTLYENQKKTVLDFSSALDNAAILDIQHYESGSGAQPMFSVASTRVFLNTYGVVLYNPTINLYDYFPQYENIRANFYSFALYGDSVTFNGITYPVTDGHITIQYVTDHGQHYLPDVMPNATVQTRTFALNNLYLTYENGHCLLTFATERFTIDLGTYTPGQETISMTGLWYFSTMVYEPYTVTEKTLSDWKILPETSGAQMLLIFIGILAVAGVAVALHARKNGLGYVDVVIIGAAALVAFFLLG